MDEVTNNEDWRQQGAPAVTVTELTEAYALSDRLSALLTGVANALKGEPGELQLHGFSDLPELAESLMRTAANQDSNIAALSSCWRGDWMDFDGRTLRDQLADLDDSPGEFRFAKGICPETGWHWDDHCDEDCRRRAAEEMEQALSGMTQEELWGEAGEPDGS